MLLMSSLAALLFLGGWLPPFEMIPFNIFPGSLWFSLKICLGVIFFIWMRAALPRYRYDQLMALGWKIFLPFSLGWLLITVSILMTFNCLPK